ncbi:MAG: DUF2085 domain-containing protein [Ktedonobacteraceae bacterium]|nr:DUF2085 domain-containing protein [Ktedonobacteraceae bacterium]
MAQRQQALTLVKSRQIWTLTLWAVFYLGALAALVLLPGGSLLERLRWLDSGICAQLPTHSFYPGGARLPLCARNTGIYLGFSITLITLYVSGRGRTQLLPPWPIVILLACGVLALAIDGVNSFFVDLGLPHLYQPHNLLRLATGLLTGLAMGALVLPLLNRQFWREYNEQRSIASWRAYLLLLPGMLLSFFAVASQSAMILYPITLLSTAGVLVALTSVNLIVTVAVGKRDQAFERYREIVPFFSLALVFAIAELLLLAQLKLALLGALGV